jgi:hypothetical protein
MPQKYRADSPTLSGLATLFEPLIRRYRPVREEQTAAYSLPDHQFDRIKQNLTRNFWITKFAGSLKVIPGDLNRMLNNMM